MTLRVMRLLGLIAILHGLAHAALPMRGSFEPGLPIGDWMPIVFYLVSTTGFVVAGLGLLGLPRLQLFISPLLVLAAAWSCAAILRFGDRELFGGILADGIFFVVGLWRGFAGWPLASTAHHDPYSHVWPSTSH